MEKLQERLAKFIGGVALVHVGGNTEAEMKEKKDRVDDALHATQCALEDGVVPGGGIALLYARKNVLDNINNQDDRSEDFKYGQKIVYDACGKPFEQILMNAGYTETDARMVAQHDLKNPKKNSWKGYNIKTREIVDMKDSGILDPHKVTKNTLLNAASIAGTILLTECTVVDNPEDKDKSDDSFNPMMM
jgi:chaperonin GroEL